MLSVYFIGVLSFISTVDSLIIIHINLLINLFIASHIMLLRSVML